jgi:hypothetical protein
VAREAPGPRPSAPGPVLFVLGLRTSNGLGVSGVLESGYGRDLVERLPELMRTELREAQMPGRGGIGPGRG